MMLLQLRAQVTMKKKRKQQRGLRLCEYTPALSDKVAVESYEFLQVISSSLLVRHCGCIERHQAKKPSPMSKRLNSGTSL
ncbi:MAG TPA: hypothetical protein PLB25_14885 [Rhodoferax sp.]|nr:hypothetical protein [Rhodoferax sp.]